MKNPKFIGLAAKIQLFLSFLLFIGCFMVWFIYHYSLGELSGAMADSILSASDVINETAQTIKTRQDLIDDTIQTLLANRKLVEQARQSVQMQGKMLPAYAGNFRDAALILRDVGVTITGLGGHLFFTMPTGMHWDGIKPVIEWTAPLEAQAKALQTDGKSISNLGITLNGMAASLTNDAPRLQAAFIESCEQTVKLFDDTVKSTETLKSDALPKAMSALENTSKNLRLCSEKTRGVDHLLFGLLLAGLALACLCACNSFIVLMLANSKKGVNP